MAHPEVLTVESFKQKIFDYEKEKTWKYNGQIPAVVDFYADWCGPCRALAPVLDELSQKYAGNLRVYKVNTEATPEIAALFGIRGIPSILFIPQVGEPAMSSGFLPLENLEKAVQELLHVQPTKEQPK